MVDRNLKGISPVIATILMVMITVGLVAFSYTWFMGMGQEAQTTAGTQISQMQKKQQSFDIPTAYECQNDTICFEFRASSMNTLEIPINTTYIKAYVDDIPKSLSGWDVGITGYTNCTDSTDLAPGKNCYAQLDITTSPTCPNGGVVVLKVSHTWGAEKMVSVKCTI